MGEELGPWTAVGGRRRLAAVAGGGLALQRPRLSPHPSRRPRAFALPGIICEFEGVNLRFSGAIAVLRAVRPLAALSIVPSMKLVMTGLTSAIFGVAVGCTDARSGRGRACERPVCAQQNHTNSEPVPQEKLPPFNAL